MYKRLVSLLALMAIVSCAKEATPTTDANASVPPVTTSSAAPRAPEVTDGLQTPESVLYDEDQDVYLISNINGQPLAADNNGYIVRVNPDTLKVEKWIEGGKNNVTLNAPKGMTIADETLYVSDLDTIRKFDDKTGAPKGEIKIPGATFLNDLTSNGSGVYVSDSGMKAGTGGNFDPTGTDAIWQISDDKPVKIASGKDLNRPNGLVLVDGDVWAVTFGSNELYSLTEGRKTKAVKLPKGSLDGVVRLDDGSFLISSWESNSVFRGPQGGPFTEVVTGVTSPADLAYDTKRKRLLVPHLMENKVTVHAIE